MTYDQSEMSHKTFQTSLNLNKIKKKGSSLPNTQCLYHRPTTRKLHDLISCTVFVLLICLFGCFQTAALAEEVTLEWTPCNVADHYVVSWGTEERTYTHTSDDIPQPPSGTPTLPYTVTGLNEGTTYHFAVQSFNASGSSSGYSDEVSITVGSLNTSPIANAGPNQDVHETTKSSPTLVTLDGSGSSDPDGDNLTYAWAQFSGPPVPINGPSQVYATFPAPTVESSGATLIFELTVTDNRGKADTSKVTISISDGDAQPNHPPSINPVQPPPASVGANDIAQRGDSTLIEPSADISSASIEIVDNTMEHQKWLSIGWDSYRKTSNEARVVSGDLNGDGNNELIIGLGPVENDSAIPGGFFQIVSHDYKHLAWGQIPWEEYNDYNGETWPACGDLNGDGRDEIVMGLGKGGQGMVAIFSYSENTVSLEQWTELPWDEYNTSLGETRPACGNIDSDNCMEIIVGLGSDRANGILPKGQYAVLDKTCSDDLASPFNSIIWGQVDWPEYNASNGETWPSCGDTDGNGLDEILLGLGTGGAGKMEIVQYTNSALEHLNWLTVDWSEYNTQLGETRPACSDINGDGTAEIIIGLGSVAGNELLPDGRFSVTNTDQNINEWGKVGSETYNKSNGESRPSPFKSNGEHLIAIGLGPNITHSVDSGTESDPTQQTPSATPQGGGGSSGGGCFINVCR